MLGTGLGWTAYDDVVASFLSTGDEGDWGPYDLHASLPNVESPIVEPSQIDPEETCAARVCTLAQSGIVAPRASPADRMYFVHAQMRARLPAAEYEVILTILAVMRRGDMAQHRAKELVEAVLAADPPLLALFASALSEQPASAPDGISRKREREADDCT